jgi:hypothetical protein
MSTIPARHIVGALLLGAVIAGGALEIALARSGAHDPTDGRWLCMPSRDTGWPAHVAAVDRALADADVTRAVLAWHDAYGAALASGRWEALVEVGDTFVRIGAGTSASGSRANVASRAPSRRSETTPSPRSVRGSRPGSTSGEACGRGRLAG